MSTASLRLKDLLPDWTEEAWKAVEQGEAGRGLRDAVAGWPALSWDVAARTILDQVKSHVDDLDVLQPVLGAWTKFRQLQQYADRKKHGPDETLLLSLREHTVSASHRPTLEVTIGEQVVTKVDFEITLALILEGIVLKVRDARIREVLAGRCRGKGTFKGAGYTLVERATEAIELPEIELGEGIAIPPP